MDGHRRQFNKEPMPNIQMYKQEFNIVENNLLIVNKTSDLDVNRDIAKEALLFTLPDKSVLTFGKDDIKLLVIKPIACASRSKETQLTIENMINNRFKDSNMRKEIEKQYKGKNKDNKKTLKIKVDVYQLETGLHITSGISESIIDVNSRNNGPLKMYDVLPLKSCQNGGRKVAMISEFKLAKDVVPTFQLWGKYDKGRIEKKDEEELLIQPRLKTTKESAIIFITPDQPKLDKIVEKNYIIKLVARRTTDGEESQAFDFHYVGHTDNDCIYCDYEPDFSFPNTGTLAEGLNHAKPGEKRKKISNMKTMKNDFDLPEEKMAKRIECDEDNSSDSHSSDSGVDPGVLDLMPSGTSEFAMNNTANINQNHLDSQSSDSRAYSCSPASITYGSQEFEMHSDESMYNNDTIVNGPENCYERYKHDNFNETEVKEFEDLLSSLDEQLPGIEHLIEEIHKDGKIRNQRKKGKTSPRDVLEGKERTEHCQSLRYLWDCISNYVIMVLKIFLFLIFIWLLISWSPDLPSSQEVLLVVLLSNSIGIISLVWFKNPPI